MGSTELEPQLQRFNVRSERSATPRLEDRVNRPSRGFANGLNPRGKNSPAKPRAADGPPSLAPLTRTIAAHDKSAENPFTRSYIPLSSPRAKVRLASISGLDTTAEHPARERGISIIDMPENRDLLAALNRKSVTPPYHDEVDPEQGGPCCV